MVSDADEFFADIVAKQKETVLQNNKCECLFITHQKTMPWHPSHMRCGGILILQSSNPWGKLFVFIILGKSPYWG